MTRAKVNRIEMRKMSNAVRDNYIKEIISKIWGAEDKSYELPGVDSMLFCECGGKLDVLEVIDDPDLGKYAKLKCRKCGSLVDIGKFGNVP
jgi:hypothetical protein